MNFKGILKYDDIRIEENAVTFIRGESGCGKSTLFHLLNATLSSDSGEIFYREKPLDAYDSVELRREVILAAQNVFLFEKTIGENFDEFRKYRDLPLLDDEEKIGYLKICRADFPLDSKCGTLSGGERQRVFIAICLSFEPKVILLDEPTSALDSATADAFFTEIIKFCKDRGITLIAISHDDVISEKFAEKSVFLGEAAK